MLPCGPPRGTAEYQETAPVATVQWPGVLLRVGLVHRQWSLPGGHNNLKEVDAHRWTARRNGIVNPEATYENLLDSSCGIGALEKRGVGLAAHQSGSG